MYLVKSSYNYLVFNTFVRFPSHFSRRELNLQFIMVKCRVKLVRSRTGYLLNCGIYYFQFLNPLRIFMFKWIDQVVLRAIGAPLIADRS